MRRRKKEEEEKDDKEEEEEEKAKEVVEDDGPISTNSFFVRDRTDCGAGSDRWDKCAGALTAEQQNSSAK